MISVQSLHFVLIFVLAVWPRLALCFFGEPSSKKAYRQTCQIFERLAFDFTQIKLPPQELIAEIFKRNAGNPRQAARAYFYLLHEERIKNLAPELRNRIDEILNRINRKSSRLFGLFTTANYDHHSKTVNIYLPSPYHETLFEYWLLTHEIEHAIYDAHLDLFVDPLPSPSRKTRALQREVLFQMEKGAMLAEWRFMQGLPKEIVDDLKRASQDKQLGETIRKILSQLLKAEDLSAEEYIKLQHQNNRYSRKQILEIIPDLPSEFRTLKYSAAILGGSAFLLPLVCISISAHSKSSSKETCDRILKLYSSRE